MRWAKANRVALVPSGGRTGLSGGAVAAKGELVLSLERMNKVLGFDAVDRTLTVEAGIPLQLAQDVVAHVGDVRARDAALHPSEPHVERPTRVPAAVGEVPPAGVRLSKILAERGICSRPEAGEFRHRVWGFVDDQRGAALCIYPIKRRAGSSVLAGVERLRDFVGQHRGTGHQQVDKGAFARP